MKPLVCIILGPTASGKSSIGIDVAKELDGEIVSADSMQLYRGMDIGTAKVREEEKQGVPHYMIDVCDPDVPYSVADYQKSAFRYIDDILSRGKMPILVGGSGLHINSVTHELDMSATQPNAKFREWAAGIDTEQLYAQLKEADPGSAARVHPNNRPRVVRALEIARSEGTRENYDFNKQSSRYDFAIFGLNMDRAGLYARINARVAQMFSDGLEAEVCRLHEMYPQSRVLAQAIGYKEVLEYIEGHASLEEAVDTIARNTRHFAKRQLTWFKRDERICWLDAFEPQKALDKIVRSV